MAKVSQKRGRLPAVGRRERQKLETRERVRAAAWSLFISAGYEKTTTKAVARKARVGTGTVFLHASDKADLLFLVMQERLVKAVDEQISTVPRGGTLLEQLMHIFRGLFRMYAEHPSLTAHFIRALPGALGPNAQMVHALTFSFLHQLAGLVRDAQQRREVSPMVEPALAANNLFVLYFGALQSWLNGFTSLEEALDPGLRLSLGLQIRGLHA